MSDDGIRCRDCGARMPSLVVQLVLGTEYREVLSTSCQLCAQLELDLGDDRYVEAWKHGTPIKEARA